MVHERSSPPTKAGRSAPARRVVWAYSRRRIGRGLENFGQGRRLFGLSIRFRRREVGADDDLVATRDGATVLVDPVSLDLIKGSELDFVDDLMGQSFRVKNPNAVASSGCGVSFTV